MPRPQKCRRICAMPAIRRFSPESRLQREKGEIVMGIDEYEVVRLLDYEGMTQEECARQLDVARSTVANIYDNARKKLADVLVNGKYLRLEGGNYRLCDENENCGKRGCRRGCCHRGQKKSQPKIPQRCKEDLL